MSAARLTKPNHHRLRQADQLRLVAPEGGGVVRLRRLLCHGGQPNNRHTTTPGRDVPSWKVAPIWTSSAGWHGTAGRVWAGMRGWRPTTLGRVSNPDRAPAEVTCDGREGAGRKDPVVLPSREVPLGGPRAMLVRRSLPQRERSLIGA